MKKHGLIALALLLFVAPAWAQEKAEATPITKGIHQMGIVGVGLSARPKFAFVNANQRHQLGQYLPGLQYSYSRKLWTYRAQLYFVSEDFQIPSNVDCADCYQISPRDYQSWILRLGVGKTWAVQRLEITSFVDAALEYGQQEGGYGGGLLGQYGQLQSSVGSIGLMAGVQGTYWLNNHLGLYAEWAARLAYESTDGTITFNGIPTYIGEQGVTFQALAAAQLGLKVRW